MSVTMPSLPHQPPCDHTICHPCHISNALQPSPCNNIVWVQYRVPPAQTHATACPAVLNE